MRAAFCPAAGRLELRDVAAPAPAPGEALVRVRACGICGSDLHWFLGGMRPPRVCPGHEIAGEIAALGRDVAGHREGDRVAVEPLVACGVCRYCRAAQPQLCRRMQIIGLQRPGGLAELVAVPATALFDVPAGLSWPIAALAEPTAVCVHACRLAALAAGDRVLILGAGSVGLLSLLAARAAGATDIWISARHAHQAALAHRLGATRVFETTPEAAAERAALAREQEVDVVLETVGGTADTLADALRCIRPGGTVVVLGVFTAPPPLPATVLLTKEVRLVGSMMYDRRPPQADFAAALALLASETARASALITHQLGLDAVQHAFEAAAARHAGAVKVSILP